MATHPDTATPQRSYRTATLTVIGSATSSGIAAVTASASHSTTLLLAISLSPLLLILGVLFPAVWSRKLARRRAALDVLRLLFTGRTTAEHPAPHSRTQPRLGIKETSQAEGLKPRRSRTAGHQGAPRNDLAKSESNTSLH